MTGEEFAGSFAVAAISSVLSAFFATKTRGEASWRSAAEARQAQLEASQQDVSDLRTDLGKVRDENKAQAEKIAGLQQQITELKAKPDYAGIQGHLDAMEARNIARHEALLAQLTAMTVQISRMGDQTTRTARTRKGDAAVASQDKTIGGRG